jgi:hypothetical protein
MAEHPTGDADVSILKIPARISTLLQGGNAGGALAHLRIPV